MEDQKAFSSETYLTGFGPQRNRAAGCQDEHSLPFGAETKNSCSYISINPYAFVASYFINQKENLPVIMFRKLI
jgi:hypothetical protein